MLATDVSAASCRSFNWIDRPEREIQGALDRSRVVEKEFPAAYALLYRRARDRNEENQKNEEQLKEGKRWQPSKGSSSL